MPAKLSPARGYHLAPVPGETNPRIQIQNRTLEDRFFSKVLTSKFEVKNTFTIVFTFANLQVIQMTNNLLKSEFFLNFLIPRF
jgi:hypothetical protein